MHKFLCKNSGLAVEKVEDFTTAVLKFTLNRHIVLNLPYPTMNNLSTYTGYYHNLTNC